MTMFIDQCDTPIGPLLVAVDTSGRVLRIEFDPTWQQLPNAVPSAARCEHVTSQLREYFAGTRLQFELDCVTEGTDFQQRAWRALQSIPFGQTISYQQQARRIGQPTATRAVGGANRSNPIPIVIPCHRVIGKDGSLTGFAGRLDKKRFLLEHESRTLRQEIAAKV